MEIYLDNSATTVPFPEVRTVMRSCLEEEYGNPSSLHRKGVGAERYLRQAREQIARTLKADPKEILFTSGGTESNNLAILGAAAAHARAGRHLITTEIEHPSVLMTMHHLEEEGYRVTYLPVDREGRVSLADLTAAMTPETILVSVMMVNNEIGTREPIEEIGALIKKISSRTLFHVDAVQGYGKYVIRPQKSSIDLLSASGHKIHGPKGTGFLYIRDGVRLKPIVFGGGQEKNLRSGTENVPGIAGLGVAAEEIYRKHEERTERLYQCREQLMEGLTALPGVTLNGPAPREGAPHVVSASFQGIRSEVLLHALEEKEIFVSSGSACSTHHPGASATLTAIGVPAALRESTLRFSFSIYTTPEEIGQTLEALRELLPFLRKFTRR